MGQGKGRTNRTQLLHGRIMCVLIWSLLPFFQQLWQTMGGVWTTSSVLLKRSAAAHFYDCWKEGNWKGAAAAALLYSSVSLGGLGS